MKKARYKFISGMVALVLTLVSVSNASAFNFAVEAQQSSKTYYVSPTGSDVSDCTLLAPCKTFTKAMNLAIAGDSVVALEGTYTQALTISKSNITIEGIKAVITASPHGIQINSAAQNVTVRGFTVTGAQSHAIYIQGQTVTVENNKVYHNVLENGTLVNGVITCGDTAWGSAIKVGLGASNVTIRNNTVFENCGEGIASTRGSNVLIENNTVYDNKSVNIYVDNSFNVQVLNNNSYCMSIFPTGIALGEEYYSGWGAQLHDVTVSGNTITNCPTGIMAFQSDVSGTLTNVTLSNNYIPYGQRRGISLDNSSNVNVLISNNTHFNDMWIRNPQGVTLTGNIKVSGTPAPTMTSVPATSAPTTTATPASTLTSVPTITQTPIPTNTAEPTLTSVPVTETSTEPPTSSSEVVYDDTDAGFVYSPEWTDIANKRAYGKSYKETSTNGASITLAFTGQSFSILFAGGPAFRNMDVYVDDILVGSINQRIDSRTYQMRWDYTGLLEPGEHVLKLVYVTNKASNTKGSLDAVIVH